MKDLRDKIITGRKSLIEDEIQEDTAGTNE